jgi:hypothetical protein
VAAFLAADHARLGEGQGTHTKHYRRIKGEDQALAGFFAIEKGFAWVGRAFRTDFLKVYLFGIFMG